MDGTSILENNPLLIDLSEVRYSDTLYREAVDKVVNDLKSVKGDGSDEFVRNLLSQSASLNGEAVYGLVTHIIKLLEKDFALADKPVSWAIARRIYRETYGLGPLEELYSDDDVSEIWCNTPYDIWIERGGIRSKLSDLRFNGLDDMQRILNTLLQFDKKEISVTSPIQEAKMYDGSRLTAVVPPVTGSISFSLRKFQSFTPTTENMIMSETITEQAAQWLRTAVRGRCNILVIGETGAGKTQFMRWLIGNMRPELRIVTLETRQELNLRQLYPDLNSVSLEENPEHGIAMSDLFRITLRMSPDIIVCGEIRSYEAEWMINAMRRGHPGSVSCMHSVAPEYVVPDIAEMICEDGKSRDQVQLVSRVFNAVDIVVQIKRIQQSGKRRVVNISELTKNTAGGYSVNRIFIRNEKKDSLEQVGLLLSDVLKNRMIEYAPDSEISREKVADMFYAY